METVHIGRMTWPQAEKRLHEARAVILPLGSTEQHGRHMATLTDTVVSDYVCPLLAQRTDCVVLPTLPYGQVWSARGFPGTVSLRQRTFIEVVKDVVVSMQNQGARNIILFSGHYGNMQPSREAARELMDERGYRNVWHLGYMGVSELNEKLMETGLWNKKTFHAAELETSIMLHIAPQLVDMENAMCEEPRVPGDLDLRPIPWEEFSETGIFGDARKASAEKGAAFLDAWLDLLCDAVTGHIQY